MPRVDLRPEPRLIPVFPLPNTVLFPGVSLPLHIFEERYKSMVSEVLGQDRALAVALAEDEGPESGAREVLTVGVITEVEDLDEGERDIVVTGSHRARIVEVVEKRPYLVARILPLVEPPTDLRLLARQTEEVRRLALDWIFFQDSEETQDLIARMAVVRQPGQLADFLAFHLFEDAPLKQEILETLELPRRLGRVQTLVAAAHDRMKSEKKK
jgi:Lon protease-like protein